MKIDMHVHTKYSEDGEAEIEDIIRRAKEIGLGGIAITDHNTTKGWKEAVELGKRYGIIVIKGEEISSKDGHILAYGIEERIEKGLSAEETVRRIKEKGGVAVAAHPFRVSNGLGPEIVRKVDFNAIEVINSRSPPFINKKAEKLAEELRKPTTGGSDAHTVEEIGIAYTVFPDKVRTEEDVLEAIRNGKEVYACGWSQGRNSLLLQNIRKLLKWIERGGKRI